MTKFQKLYNKLFCESLEQQTDEFLDNLSKEINKKYKKITSNQLDGLEVKNDIPNLSSIPASFNHYETLSDLYAIPLKNFSLTGKSYSKSETERIKNLSEEIKHNKYIKPLIIVFDEEGVDNPYILEGSHRAEALYLLKKKDIPALVIIDMDK